MRILQVSNLSCHLQLPLARQILELVGPNNFRFAATAKPDQNRIKLGWNLFIDEPWILRAGESALDCDEFEKWWDTADVVICGDRRFSRMQDRLQNKKICFYMSERWWKPPIGRGRLLWPPFYNLASQFKKIAVSEYFHYLPIGVYAATDILTIAKLNDRIWKWGYFTQTSNSFQTEVDKELNINNASKNLKILWVGRMLNWKKIDTLIKAVRMIAKAGHSFSLTLVGIGPEKERLVQMASRELPSGSFVFMDPMPSSEIPRLMQNHNVYVLPSSDYEGWGAVINEAMECKCAVVASRQSGAAASMITHGKNGMLFDAGDSDTLAQHLTVLATSPSFREELAQSGFNTIQQLWNPKIAASRLIDLSESLISRKEIIKYDEGPLSSALTWQLAGR